MLLSTLKIKCSDLKSIERAIILYQVRVGVGVSGKGWVCLARRNHGARAYCVTKVTSYRPPQSTLRRHGLQKINDGFYVVEKLIVQRPHR